MSEKETTEKLVCSPEVEELITKKLEKVIDVENQLGALKPHLDNIVVSEEADREVLMSTRFS